MEGYMEALIFPAVLLSAAFLCSLVAGFLFAFAVVVMPGIGRLNNREFIRAFQLMDRVIQNGQPLFVLAWVGSGLAVLATAVLGFWTLAGGDRLLVISAALVYLLCVQVSTVAINIPLNNALQQLNPDSMDAAAAA